MHITAHAEFKQYLQSVNAYQVVAQTSNTQQWHSNVMY